MVDEIIRGYIRGVEEVVEQEKPIFIGTQEIAGMMSRLHNAFTELGVKSIFYRYKDYRFDKQLISCPNEIKKCYDNIILTSKAREDKRYIYFAYLQIIRVWLVLRFFFDVLHKHDKFIYIFGSNIFSISKILRPFSWLELFVLRLLKKKVIVMFCGSDSRAPFCNGAYSDDIDWLNLETKRIFKMVRLFEKYAWAVIDGAGSAFFHSKPYILSQKVGIPISIPAQRKVVKDKLIILHAPSDLKGKGTAIVREIIGNLKNKGYDFEYKELHGVPHSEVEIALETASLVIDQVYSDTPLAGLATEAAAVGVASLVGGYYAVNCREDKIFSNGIPSFFVVPEKLEIELEYLLNHREVIYEKGMDARRFVSNVWEEKIVAKKFLNIFAGEIDKDYYINPMDVKYIWGWGISKDRVIKRIRGLVNKYGMSCLCIDKKMKLYKEYLNLISMDDSC